MLSALLAAVDDPSAQRWTFFITTVTVLGAIVVALINTRHNLNKATAKVEENQAMVVEIHHMVNSQRTAMEQRIDELARVIVSLGGEVPIAKIDPVLLSEVELAGGIMTVSGEATTITGDTVSISGEATINPPDDGPVTT